MITPLPHHPYADLFPMIQGKEYSALVASIAEGGLCDDIVTMDGMVLDGRNRQRACIEAGVTPRYVEFSGPNPLRFVVDKNVRRRHLDESQRAIVAATIATMGRGRPKEASPDDDDKPANLPDYTQAEASEIMNVSERLVRSAKAVLDRGTPEIQEAARSGRLPVSVAVNAAKLQPEQQNEIAKLATQGDPGRAKSQIKKDARDQKEKVLAGLQRALPTKRYGLIYVDVPRHFHVRSDDTGMDRSPENHYPTMTFEELCDLPVGDIAADDCILIYWSTAASLIDDLEIMAEWGFVTFRPREAGRIRRDELRDGSWRMPNQIPQPYRSMQVWDKVKIGLGYWFRDRHEFVLIGARGNIVPPAQGTQDDSIFAEKKGEHSAKPTHVAEMIERLWPNTPKIELFARVARPGWDIWGKEAPIEGALTHDIEQWAEAVHAEAEVPTGTEAPMIGTPPAPTQSQPETQPPSEGESTVDVHDLDASSVNPASLPPCDGDAGTASSFDYPELPTYLRRTDVDPQEGRVEA